MFACINLFNVEFERFDMCALVLSPVARID